MIDKRCGLRLAELTAFAKLMVSYNLSRLKRETNHDIFDFLFY